MTEQELRKHINNLNTKKVNESIFKRQISNTVEVAKVWSTQPKLTDEIKRNHNSSRIFFIKNQSNNYVGAVLDMCSDLHWFVLPKYRGKGYLTQALRGSILPYLFQNQRDCQKITIVKDSIGNENYLRSRKVAIELGFKSTNKDDTEFELSKSDFNYLNVDLEEINSDIELERVKILKQRIYFTYWSLCKISRATRIKLIKKEEIHDSILQPAFYFGLRNVYTLYFSIDLRQFCE